MSKFSILLIMLGFLHNFDDLKLFSDLYLVISS